MQHHHRAYMLKEDELDNQQRAETSFSNGSELVRQLKQGKQERQYNASLGQLPRTSGEKRCEPPTSLFLTTSSKIRLIFAQHNFRRALGCGGENKTRVEKNNSLFSRCRYGLQCAILEFVPPLRRVSLGIGRVPCRTDCQVKGWRGVSFSGRIRILDG